MIRHTTLPRPVPPTHCEKMSCAEWPPPPPPCCCFSPSSPYWSYVRRDSALLRASYAEQADDVI